MPAILNLLNSPFVPGSLGRACMKFTRPAGAIAQSPEEHRCFGGPACTALAKFCWLIWTIVAMNCSLLTFAEAQRWTADTTKPELAAQRLRDAFTETVDGKAAITSSVEVYLSGSAAGEAQS